MSNIPQDSTPVKLCTKCHQSFPATFEYFYRTKNTKDGFQTPCKACHSAYHATHKEHRKAYLEKYNQEHADELKEKRLQYYQENQEEILHQRAQHRKEHREAFRASRRKHYQEHKEEALRYKAQYRDEHREEWNASSRKYHAEHKEACNAYSRQYGKTPKGRMIDKAKFHKRRAAKHASPGSYTADQIQEKLKAQKHRCYYCQAKLKKEKGHYVYHIDHIVPLSRNGDNTIDNVVISCPACNMSKKDKLPHEWTDGGRLL